MKHTIATIIFYLFRAVIVLIVVAVGAIFGLAGYVMRNEHWWLPFVVISAPLLTAFIIGLLLKLYLWAEDNKNSGRSNRG